MITISKTCWQIMHTDDFVLLDRWIDNWKDLMECEIIPVTLGRMSRDH